MERRKLLFVFNPFSGKGQIKSKLFEIVDQFVKSGYEVTVYPTQKPQDAMELVKERAGEYELVICSGGDGTLDEVVTGMMCRENKRPIGYIPAGSPGVSQEYGGGCGGCSERDSFCLRRGRV